MDDTITTQQPGYPVYPAAIVLAFFSAMICLLIIPPMWWHIRNRNIGATALVFWILILNFLSFLNALIWPTDKLSSWYSGNGLCDLEVKLQVGAEFAILAAAMCVLRALAAVMDTERTTLGLTKAQRRKATFIDCLWCFGMPLMGMIFHLLVQTNRYYVFGISGCVPSYSTSWVAMVLLLVTPLILTLACAYYAILIIIRLHRYRLTFMSMLAGANTTKSRFMRLFLVCVTWVFGWTFVELYVFYVNASVPQNSFVWSEVHSPESWHEVILVPSGGKVIYDRWVWLASGVLVFIFFGMGSDAMAMYKHGLLTVGAAKILPQLRPGYSPRPSGSLSSFSSRAKLYFRRKSASTASSGTWKTVSEVSHGSVKDSMASPETTTFLELIHEESTGGNRKHTGSQPSTVKPPPTLPNDIEKGMASQQRTSPLSQLTSKLRGKSAAKLSSIDEPMQLVPISITRANTVHTNAFATEPSPAFSKHIRGASEENVVVRKEVRQGSESVEVLPQKTYGKA